MFDLPTAPLLASLAMATACAVLSVLVVPQRWTFIGEGIGHSGLGGAGLAWMLALLFPVMNNAIVAQFIIVIFCLATAIAIGFFTRHNRVQSDAAIGIFMVASLAFGLLASNIYLHFRTHSPIGFNAVAWGQIEGISPTYAGVAMAASTLIILTIGMLRKEILSYCLDPVMAEVTGVRVGFIHYLLMILTAITVLIGMRIVGSILVTALLILPGTTGALLSDRLRGCTIWAIAIAMVSALAGVMVNAWKSFLPAGPAMVLVLFVIFIAAYTLRGRRV